MRRFGWRNAAAEDDPRQTSPGSDDQRVVDTSPARSLSYRSTNSSRSGLSKSGVGGNKDESPSKLGAAAGGRAPDSAGSGGGVGGAASNKKMLKIGANVRFRGDVMECNTVIVCGRLQGFVETRRLTVKEGGKFVGDAKVEDADVNGSFDGSLESTSKISIGSKGSILGSVVYRRMSMEDGGS